MRERLVEKGRPIFVVSGGTGASGDLLVQTVLAQFTDVQVPVEVMPHVHTPEQIDAVVRQAEETGGVIVHTLVNHACRQSMLEATTRHGVWQFDLAGPLMSYLAGTLARKPVGEPGRFRRLNRSYFARIEAIEFAVAHDDGKRPEDLPLADIVLVGVSRVGKTPLSMYLAFQGWKVANVPYVAEVPLPAELFAVAPDKMVGLIVEPGQLIQHRRTRLLAVGAPEGSYVARDQVVEELRAVRHFFAKHDIPVLDTSDMPVETIAGEVLKLVKPQSMQETVPA